MIVFGFHLDMFWVLWGVGSAIGLYVCFRLVKVLIVMEMGRSLIDYNKDYGGGDLRIDRIPRLISFRRAKR